MFQWFLDLFRRKEVRKLTEDEMICVRMKDGSVKPLINDPDKLELITYPDGTAEIRVKK